MAQKILFFNPYSCWSFHLETDLEIIKKHIDHGDLLTILTCDGDLLSCEANPQHIISTCQGCIDKRILGLNILGLKDKVELVNLLNLSDSDRKNIAKFPQKFKNLRELKSLEINNFDIGLAVTSSLIDYCREPYPNPVNHQDFVRKNIVSGLITYFSLLNHIEKIKPSKIYIFNGRYTPLRAALRAAQRLKINFNVQERAGVQGKYSLTPNTYPHDLNYQTAAIQSFWNTSNLPESEKVVIGSQWFLDRRSGNDQGWFSFIRDKNDSLENVRDDTTKIVIFNSSQDEFEAISGWENPIYKSQNQAIFKLALEFKNNKNIDLFLRIHPNLSNINNSQTKALKKLKGRYENFHVIDAEEKINSYELMDLATLVITFGSTMGVEAAFYEKLTVLAGRSIYEDLDTGLKIKSHKDLTKIIECLTNQDFLFEQSLKKKQRKLNATKYGFYQSQYGVNFEIFEQRGVFKMLYHNIELSQFKGRQSLPIRALLKISRKIHKLFLKRKYFSLSKKFIQ